MKAQFFYSSPLPIDDPLSAVPTPAGSDSKAIKHPPRPFSARDNNALEEAWLGLAPERPHKIHNKGKTTILSNEWRPGELGKRGDNLTLKQNERLASSYSKKSTYQTMAPSAGPSNSGHNPAPEPVRSCNLCKCSQENGMLADRCSCNALAKPSDASATPGTEIIKFDGWPRRTSKSRLQQSENPKMSTGAEATLKPEDPPSFDGDQLYNDFNRAKVADASEDSQHPYDSNHAEDKHRSADEDRIREDSDNVQERHISGSPAAGLEPNHHSNSAKEVPFCKGMDNGAIPRQQTHNADTSPCKDTGHNELIGKAKVTKNKGRRVGENEFGSKIVTQYSSASDKSHIGGATDDRHLDVTHNSVLSKTYKVLNTPKAITVETEAPFNEDESGLTTQMSGFRSLPRQSGTTGMPFLKYTSPSASFRSHSPNYSTHDEIEGQNNNQNLMDDDFISELDSENPENLDHNSKVYANNKQDADVPVGISRLHLVKLPALQMHPIYWSPVHDIAVVTRATWFYKDTMYPVEPAVANQLEMGYRELRPWSRTWNDELNSALEVGVAGEEKISHRLWLQVDDKKDGFQISQESVVSADSYCAKKFFQEAAAEGRIDSNDFQRVSGPKAVVKSYPQSHVIYKDAQNAYILKPSLQPSSYYGRRPLQKIKRGITVGIHVVRGFDWRAWEKVHPSKKSKVAVKVAAIAPVAGDADVSKRTSCTACSSLEKRPKVTDLILVIHGIGQKLSERVESFHFTHAINDFRRSVNVELCNEAVQPVMRDDLGGVMVLPVNWRSNLSFEDGGPLKDGDNAQGASNFSLKDITPETIPAVRNLISDVMLDIPFYMSHHKPKMIQAVISEANRVYRLWCKNNPEFHEEGRVHIIAHSLGSVMAVEVLSKQPTSIPKIDLLGEKINTKYFDFDTTNLFFCGSPAGFFLLLDKGNLIPRRSQGKVGSEKCDDEDPAITGAAGTFGCLAVDNIYNVMHYNDPIAYRLNATVDEQYAASLKNAQVPSATTGFLETIGKAVKSIAPGISAPTELAVGQVVKPSAVRLPSQLEMEIHDFTREEMAERKFSLLNDNGQVDWFLSSGGGPLEIQYLNMLSAHSSYWGSPDFIRMVVLECGRKPGKGNALPNMRAVKIRQKS